MPRDNNNNNVASNSYTESTHLCGLFRARLVKVAHAQLSLQSHVHKIPTSLSVATAVHRHE